MRAKGRGPAALAKPFGGPLWWHVAPKVAVHSRAPNQEGHEVNNVAFSISAGI
jgi:hypothetical protein